jgi:hypothetical protein
MSKCRYCSEDIEWRESPDGKKIPTNPNTGQRHVCPNAPGTVSKHDIQKSQDEYNKKGSAIPSIEGQIVGKDDEKRLLRVKDIEGTSHLIIWPAFRDEVFKKQKEWWFVRVTGEYKDHEFVPEDVTYWKKPDNWPASKGYGKSFQPRNEKIIVAQTLLKCWTELWFNTITPDSVNFDQARDEILTAVENDLERVMKAGGT